MLVVTTDEIHGWDVQRVCGEVFGLSLRARTAPGAEGEKNLSESRNEVISRMLEHARSKGGNAVVGLRFDTSELGEGFSELCAYGTAVVAVPVDEGAKQTATALGYGQPGGAPANPEPPAQQQQYDPNQQYAHQQYAQQYPQQQPAYSQPQYDPNQQYPQQYPGQQYPPQQPGQQQYPPQQYPPQQGYPQQ